jgi:hypothetical protein
VLSLLQSVHGGGSLVDTLREQLLRRLQVLAPAEAVARRLLKR